MGAYGALGRFGDNRGISLIEVTMIVVIVAIMAAVAMKSMTPSIENARKRKTEREMKMLVEAVAGNPSVMSVAGGVRSDFGYVGDVGAFPPDLDALLSNPGAYSTWDGPYIPPQYALDTAGFKTDEWGETYDYTGGTSIASHGSGTTMRHRTASDSLDYLRNTVDGRIRDSNDSVPGLTYADSVDLEITVPDGAGSTSTKTYHPDSSGSFTLDSIPVGRHLIEAIFVPEVDTLTRYVTVLPRHGSSQIVRFDFALAHFSTEDTSGGGTDSMLTLVESSESVYGTSCENISFDIQNNTGEDVTVSSVTLSWVGQAAFYQWVYWADTVVFNGGSSRHGKDEQSDFDESKTIDDGSTVTIKIENFRDKATGSSSAVDMSSETYTAEFSDGSIIEFTVGSCP